MRKLVSLVLTMMLAGLVAACQTVPPPHGLNARQIAVLQENGFRPNGDAWELGMLDRLLFETEESDLRREQVGRLAELSAKLGEVGIKGATIEGHTDAAGTRVYNMALSQRRAEAVKRALIGGGMKAEAITARGLGETVPIESNTTAEGRAQNRRVVIIITAQDAL